MKEITPLTPELLSALQSGQANSHKYLFIERHPDLQRGFLVNGFDPSWHARMQDVVGQRKIVLPFNLRSFQEKAEAEGFEVVALVMDDVQQTFEWLQSLVETPEVKIESSMEGTVNGFLPFQVQGYNMLKRERAGWLHWSTGTGKTVGAAGLTKYHQEQGNFDLGMWVVKAHNKINTARSLEALVGIEAYVVSGTAAKRRKLYEQIAVDMLAGKRPVIVINYEQFRNDSDYFTALVADHKLLMVWDEAPTKLKNRKTKLWRSLCSILYTSDMKGIPYPDSNALRPSQMHVYVTSATPIRNSPEDFYNVVRLISPDTFGGTKKFEDAFVAYRDPWNNIPADGWKNLDLMGIKVSHFTHQVDKADPDIAKQFPEVRKDTVLVDLSDKQRKLYTRLQDEYAALKDNEASELDYTELLAAIGVFQMICDDPRMVLDSAIRREAWEARKDAYMASCGHAVGTPEYEAALATWKAENEPEGSKVALTLRNLIADDSAFDDDGSKTEALQELLADNAEKSIVFNTWAHKGIPAQSAKLNAWGIEHVTIAGGLPEKERQARQDRFTTDEACRVFLSSDAGSDSINLEVANLVVHYNLPWAPDTYIQRENRAHRITSSFQTVRFVTLVTDTAVEARKQEILDTKIAYHNAVLKGEVAELSQAMREFTRDDLIYILTGRKKGE